MAKAPIAIITDFGYEDWFVGTMKGVIAGIAPDSAVIDISHKVSSFNVREGAFTLWNSYSYFPENTVFCLVVDPGVGSPRDALVATDGRYFFVAPDNGLLSYVARKAGDNWKVYKATNRDYFLKPISSTFQGRDIFAPLSAHITMGVEPSAMGEVVEKMETLPLPEPQRVNGVLEGEVLYIDHFGNLITNIKLSHIRAQFDNSMDSCNWNLKIGNLTVPGISRTFAESDKDEVLFYSGSSEFLEISVNMGSAEKMLSASVGMPVFLAVEQ